MKASKVDQRSAIICGTDFSEAAQCAANAAVAIARRLNAPLVLLHPAEECGGMRRRMRGNLMGSGGSRLAREAERLRASGVSVEENFVEKGLGKGVARYAEMHGGRMVVVSASNATAGEAFAG